MRSFIQACRTLFTGRIVSVEAVRVEMPAGNLADYEIIRHPGAAAIVAVDARALVSLVLVNLISLALILSVGAALLRGT